MTHEHHADRRSFLKTGAIASTALAAGATTLAKANSSAAAGDRPPHGREREIHRGAEQPRCGHVSVCPRQYR